MLLFLLSLAAICGSATDTHRVSDGKSKKNCICAIIFVTESNDGVDTPFFLSLRLDGSVGDLKGHKFDAESLKKYLLQASKEFMPKAVEIDLNVEETVSAKSLSDFVHKIESFFPDGCVVHFRVRFTSAKTEIVPSSENKGK